MANRYVVASGNWNDTAVWSTSSGGAGGASVPTSADISILDSNSGGSTVTVNSAVETGNFVIQSTADGLISITSSGVVSVYGGSLQVDAPASLSNSGLFVIPALSNVGAISVNGSSSPDIGKLEVRKTNGRIVFSDSMTVDLRAYAYASNVWLDITASITLTLDGFDIDGDIGSVFLRSVTEGTQYTLDAQSAFSVAYLDVQDANNTGTTIDATAATNKNSGNNAGINFADFSSSSASSVSISLSSSSTSASSVSSSSSDSLTTSSSSTTLTSTTSSSSSTVSSQSSGDSSSSSTSISLSSSSTTSTSDTSTSSRTVSTSSSQTSSSSTTSSSSNTPSTSSSSSSSDSGTSSSTSTSSSSSTSTSNSSATSLSSSSSTSSASTSTTSTSTSSSESTSATSVSSSSSVSLSSSSTTSSQSEESTPTSVSSSSSDSSTTSSCSSKSTSSSLSESGYSSSSISTGSECYDDAPWLHVERQIKAILDADTELNRLSKRWPDHVIIGIEDNLLPPRNGLAVPIVEFEVEDVDDSRANHEEDALVHTIRFKVTHNINDKSRHRFRNLARQLMRPLRQNLTRHENQFTFAVSDISENGEYRFVDIVANLTIWVDSDTLNR